MNMNYKKQQQGFTLIELIMVIVVLGILSAVALPKFADLKGDANSAVVNGTLGAAKAALAIVHSKSLVTGVSAGTVTLEGGTTVTVAAGYPSDATELNKAIDGGTVSATASTCGVQFTAPSTLTADTSGC